MKKLFKKTFTFFLTGASISLSAQTLTFNYTGGVQTYTVPSCVTSITVDAKGAQGGGTGGFGGRVQCTMPVTPGDVLNIYVGGQGGPEISNSAGGFNGGGTAGTCSVSYPGAGGGGASDIRVNSTALANRAVVAGGGGGSHPINSPSNAGVGGGLLGGDVGNASNGCIATYATGGTQSAGGAAATPTASCCFFTPVPGGSFGVGGNGAGPSPNCNNGDGGAGGGGGWYGGGGGGTYSSGGGGSSYTAAGVTAVTHTQGFQSGNGQVIITPVNGVPAPGAITGSSTICANASGSYSIASLVGATSYTWTVPAGTTINSGQGTTAINITAGSTSGNISVTATFPCGTSLPTTFSLTINPAPTVVANSTAAAVCAGSSVTLSGSGATTYSWSGGVTNAVPFVPVSTLTYTVTGTTAGCTNTATTTVTVNPLPTVTANTTANAVCAGTSVTLTGGGASTYAWSGGVTNAVSFIPVSTLTYTVTGTSSAGCTNTATTTVTVNPLPMVTANSSAVAVCAGNSVTLTGGGASTYIWSGGVTNAVSFVPVSTLTYTVIGTGANSCINTATTTVTVNPLPTVTANSTAAAVCAGSSVTLSGGGVVSYTWDNSVSDGLSFVPVATNTYVVTGTDANGCINTATTTVTVNPLPIVVANSTATAVCTGSPVTLTGGGATTYAWDNNVVDGVSFVPSATITYMVTGTDANACVNTATTTVTVNPLPTVTGTATTTTACLADGSISLTGTPAGGTWSGPGVTASSFSPATAGVGAQTASYSFTDANGCSAIAAVVITVNACTGVVDQTLSNGISIFPNPNNGTFTIAVDANVGDLTMEVTDMQGRVVYTSVDNNVHSGFVKQISLDTQASGLYLLHIIANGEQKTQKISVQK